MVKRPKLSDVSFLGHLFSPKRQPLPTGLRKTVLKGTKGQRKGRVAAFNRMSPFNQELLKRSGTRDSYLRGETSLADAKRTLRPTAERQGLAKPLRNTLATPSRRERLERFIADHIKRTARNAGRPVNPRTVDAEIVWLGDSADENMLGWDYGRLKYAGRQGSEYEVLDDRGRRHNPFWYH